jgi:hypothetical protein
MMQVAPWKRCTAEQALEHPYLDLWVFLSFWDNYANLLTEMITIVHFKNIELRALKQ